MTNWESQQELICQQMLVHPLPGELCTVLEEASRHYPTVSVLQLCVVDGDSYYGWKAELSYTVFIPLLGSNSCIIQYLHNTVILRGDGSVVDEKSSMHGPSETLLPKAREEWNRMCANGWRTYLKNVVVS